MLFLLNKGNHPSLDYKGGQRPIVHLEADMHEAIRWAEQLKRHWAFHPDQCQSRLRRFLQHDGQTERDQLVRRSSEPVERAECRHRDQRGEAGRISALPIFPLVAGAAYRSN